jgi:hyperosmotically inducible protein
MHFRELPLRRVVAAVALATTLGGCTSVSGPGGAGLTVEDAALVARVKGALLRGPEGESRIDVDAAEGVVTLRGTVGSDRAARDAVNAARRVTGVRDVKSELRVQPAS